MIDELQSVEESREKRQNYLLSTPVTRAEICKHAAEYGNASVVRTMSLKYPGLKQQTVSDFKLTYSKLKKVRKLLTMTLQRL